MSIPRITAILEIPTIFPEIKKTIAQSSTAEQLIVTSTPCRHVTIQANKNNAGTVYVGPAAVSTDSFALEAGNSITICISNANLIYVYGTAADKVVALYTP
jgi:hypothetical protein